MLLSGGRSPVTGSAKPDDMKMGCLLYDTYYNTPSAFLILMFESHVERVDLEQHLSDSSPASKRSTHGQPAF